MPKFPRLKITHWIDGHASTETLEFEQAPYFLFHNDVIVIVEGTVIRSHEELLDIVSQESHRNKDFIDVRMETIIGGG